MSHLSHALDYAAAHADRFLAELNELVRIPSVSKPDADPKPVREAADWLVNRLRAIPLDRVEVFETIAHPVIFGELRAADDAPTMLIYGHYDVVRAEPLAAWNTPPFEPTRVEQQLYGRGVSDMKGQLLACIAAVEAAQAGGDLPVNVKFLIEGNEEYVPDVLSDLFRSRGELFACDFAFSADAGMLGADLPTIVYGLRGKSLCRLTLTGPARDVHDGMFGGAVHNPIHVAADLIAGLHDERGRVTLPGFYDKVRPVSAEERALLAQIPPAATDYRALSGAPALWGDDDFTPAERIGARPALNVIHFDAGAGKGAIPSTVALTFSIRLAADQEPEEIYEQFRAYVAAHVPPTMTWETELRGKFSAVLTDRHSPGVLALSRALANVWGREPVFYREGGGIPAITRLQAILGIDSVLTGFGLPDDGIHGPNEHLHLPTWRRGIDAMIHFVFELGTG